MKHLLTLNLNPDPELISRYEELHSPENIPNEIVKGIQSVGILEMEIYRWENRLFMIIETEDDFNWEEQMKILSDLPGQRDWEKLMDKYQERLSPGDEKWMKMSSIFKLTDCK